MYVKAEGNYSTFYLDDSSKVTISKQLKSVETILPESFLRPHQSYIVNRAFIEKYVRGDGGYLIVSSGVKIPVSRRKKDELIARLTVV